MKLQSLIFAFFALSIALSFTSCSKDAEEILIDTSKPQGTFTASKTGALVTQNNTPTAGTVRIGTDSKGVQFVQLGSDFKTEQGTGTVSIYLSTTMNYVASPGTGNPDLRLLGTLRTNGEHNYIAVPTVESKFTHLIVWCGSAGVPFGYAKFQ